MKNTFYFLLFILSTLFMLSSCDDDDPIIPNEEELITTVLYILEASDGSTDTLLFEGLKLEEGLSPFPNQVSLRSGTSYTGTIQLWNDSANPRENITTEVKAEDTEHQFFFSSSIEGISVSYTDEDDNGLPLGLSTRLEVADSISAQEGLLTITLKHEPNKTASGVADGDISNAEGETDIEVSFPINVE